MNSVRVHCIASQVCRAVAVGPVSHSLCWRHGRATLCFLPQHGLLAKPGQVTSALCASHCRADNGNDLCKALEELGSSSSPSPHLSHVIPSHWCSYLENYLFVDRKASRLSPPVTDLTFKTFLVSWGWCFRISSDMLLGKSSLPWPKVN